jgi:hypothetical protein
MDFDAVGVHGRRHMEDERFQMGMEENVCGEIGAFV